MTHATSTLQQPLHRARSVHLAIIINRSMAQYKLGAAWHVHRGQPILTVIHFLSARAALQAITLQQAPRRARSVQPEQPILTAIRLLHARAALQAITLQQTPRRARNVQLERPILTAIRLLHARAAILACSLRSRLQAAWLVLRGTLTMTPIPRLRVVQLTKPCVQQARTHPRGQQNAQRVPQALLTPTQTPRRFAHRALRVTYQQLDRHHALTVRLVRLIWMKMLGPRAIRVKLVDTHLQQLRLVRCASQEKLIRTAIQRRRVQLATLESTLLRAGSAAVPALRGLLTWTLLLQHLVSCVQVDSTRPRRQQHALTVRQARLMLMKMLPPRV